MKAIAIAAATLALSIASANAAMDVASGSGRRICLYPHEIDHTHVVNSSTILFHMKDGKVFENTLKTPCQGLVLHGFAYVAHDVDEICSDATPISIFQTGETCALGTFVPYSGPATNPG